MCLEILWIVVGFLYILYKGLREGEYTPLAILIVVAILVALAQLDISAGGIVAILLVLCVVIFVVVSLLLDSSNDSENSNDLVKSKKRLKKHNYYNIKDEDINYIINSPSSPFKTGGSFFECYDWLCKEKTYKINSLSEENLIQQLGVPLYKLPIDTDIPVEDALQKREILAKNYILKKDGLQYRERHKAYILEKDGKCYKTSRTPSYIHEETEYVKMFYKFLDTYDFQKGMTSRKKELETLVETDFEEFERLSGYNLPKYEYPFSNKWTKEERIEVAIYEILNNEGYLNLQPSEDIKEYGKWEDRKVSCDRAYELFTMKHSDFEKVYGAKLPEEQLRDREKIVEIIALREGWKYDGWRNNPVGWGDRDVAYELLKD